MINSFSGQHRWLSNFHPAPVIAYGITFQSVEHAYQACKCALAGERHRFLNITAGQAKRLGRTVEMRSDWLDVRLRLMKELVRRKFENPELRSLLLSTGTTVLVEGNQWGDTFWGVCKGVGENHLGLILMEIREELRAHVSLKPLI